VVFPHCLQLRNRVLNYPIVPGCLYAHSQFLDETLEDWRPPLKTDVPPLRDTPYDLQGTMFGAAG